MIRYILRSDHADSTQLRDVAHVLERRFVKKRPATYLRLGADSVVIRTHDSLESRVQRLPDPGCFRFEKHPRLGDFELGNEILNKESTRDPAFAERRDWFSQHGTSFRQASFFVGAIDRGKPTYDPARQDAVDAADISLGLTSSQESSLSFVWRRCERKGDDPASYREFLRGCFAACGLEQDMRFEQSEQGFTIKSEKHVVKFPAAKWGGFDPSGVRLNAPDLATAFRRLEQTLEAFGATAISASLGVECQDDQYTAHRAAWNRFGGDWELRVRGGYAADFDPFAAPLPAEWEYDAIYPLLFWDEGGDRFTQCDLLATPTGRRLQLTTNAKTEKKLLERFNAAAIELPFQLVDVAP